jgi:hypothetical protein
MILRSSIGRQETGSPPQDPGFLEPSSIGSSDASAKTSDLPTSFSPTTNRTNLHESEATAPSAFLSCSIRVHSCHSWFNIKWSRKAGIARVYQARSGTGRQGRLLRIPDSGSPPPSARRTLQPDLPTFRPHFPQPRIARIFTNRRRPRRRHSSPAPFVSIRAIRGSTSQWSRTAGVPRFSDSWSGTREDGCLVRRPSSGAPPRHPSDIL